MLHIVMETIEAFISEKKTTHKNPPTMSMKHLNVPTVLHSLLQEKF